MRRLWAREAISNTLTWFFFLCIGPPDSFGALLRLGLLYLRACSESCHATKTDCDKKRSTPYTTELASIVLAILPAGLHEKYIRECAQCSQGRRE